MNSDCTVYSYTRLDWCAYGSKHNEKYDFILQQYDREFATVLEWITQQSLHDVNLWNIYICILSD